MTVYEYVRSLCSAAKEAAADIACAKTAAKNALLCKIADALGEKIHMDTILAANAEDVEAARAAGTRESMIDRLSLTEARLAGIADALREVAALPDPVGKGEREVRPNGLEIIKTKVPLGVVAIIYEARPNVTVDAAALCLKSGNAVVLRGGSDAIRSNQALVSMMQTVAESCGFSKNVISLVEDTTRDSANALMEMRGLVDVLIPRGGASLIRSVVENAKVPVIETGAGNCHMYVERDADLHLAVEVALNAKMSRPSVCNAIETLLVHRDVAAEFLPAFAEAAAKYPAKLEIRGCAETCAILPDAIPATEEDYATEFDDYILAVKIVGGCGEAIAHIRRYTTGHSEAIITRSLSRARRFQREVDAAAVYVNASTRFTDGGEFGLGAEIGISTQKLHRRGPMGLDALTTDKFLVMGEGQVR